MARNSAIDPLTLVIGECITISSEMRKIPKWSQTGVAAILGGQLYSGRDLLFGSDSEESGKFGIANTSGTHPRAGGDANGARAKGDSPLVGGFIQLRILLSDVRDIADVDTLTLLQPFLMVIRSSSTSGYITALALSSLSKLLQHGVVCATSKNIAQSLPQIVSSLTRCRFEAGDQASDDAVLLKVLRLLESTLNSDLGDLLSDDVVYEVIQTCLSLACNKRRSEVLRRAAEMAMTSVTIRIFGKLQDIAPEASQDDAALRSDHHVLQEDTIGGTDGADGTDGAEVGTEVGTEVGNADGTAEGTDVGTDAGTAEGSTEGSSEGTTEGTTEATAKPAKSAKSTHPDTATQHALPPYGIPCIKEYLGVLIYMISPSNQYAHMESTRVFAFSLVTTAIEVSARHLPSHPSLMAMVADPICKNLLQTVQSVDQPSLLYAALQLFVTLTVAFRDELKLQIELVLLTIFKSISPDFDRLNDDLVKNSERFLKFDDREHTPAAGTANPDALAMKNTAATVRSSMSKEMLIETTSILWSRFPTFFVGLFVNYDCDFDRQDTGVNVIKYLCRLSLPDSALISTDNVPPIALEGLLSFVNGVNERVKGAGTAAAAAPAAAADPHPLIVQKTQKQAFLECMKVLNEDDKRGLAMLHEHGFIRDLADTAEMAKFYFEKSAGLNKKKLGELLAKPSNAQLLQSFMALFNFAGLRVDEALRVLLKSFRLPGESQQIERIVETFADQYVGCQEGTEAEADTEASADASADAEEAVRPDKDAVFVLSYSVIMLNTDLHNPIIKNHMTLEQYQRNLRGVYAGKDFPGWYTEKIYNSIKEREIIIPEEHHGTAKWFDDMWNNLILQHETHQLAQQQQQHAAAATQAPDVQDYTPFDRVLFSKTSDFVISTLLTIFEEASDDHIITRMMTTLDKCANIACFYRLDDVLDRLVEVLSHLTTLTGVKASQLIVEEDAIRDVIPVTQIKVEESQETITVSEVSVWFGRDFKAQLATIELFRILKKSAFRISGHWINIVTIVLTLFENCLVDPDVFPEFQKKLNLPPIPKVKPQFQINRNKALKESGFLSSFSAFLKGYSDEPPEPTDEEIQSTLSTINCIKSSNLMRLFSSISNTDPANLDNFVRLLLQLLPIKSKSTVRFYDAEVIFILEIAVCMSLVSMNAEIISLIVTIIDELFESHKQNGDDAETPEPLANVEKSAADSGRASVETQQAPVPGQAPPAAPQQQQQQQPQPQTKSAGTIKVSTLVRLSTYKLLLLRNSNQASETQLHQTIDRLHTIDRSALLRHGFPLIKPLGSLIDNGTWTKAVVQDKEQYWALIRSFASSLKHSKEMFELIQSRIEDCISETSYFLILGLLDEISSAGAVGAQWEQEYEKLVKTGHKVEDKNPYAEVIATSIESIKLTGSIKAVVDYKILIQALCHQCYNPCSEIRVFAIQALDNALMASANSANPISADSVSENCLFTLLADIMKPENVMDINILKMITKYYLRVGLGNIKSGYVLKYVKIVQLMIRKADSKDFEEQAVEMLKNMYLIFEEENRGEAENVERLEQLRELIGLPGPDAAPGQGI